MAVKEFENYKATAEGNLSLNTWQSVRLELPLQKAIEPFLAFSSIVGSFLSATLSLLQILKNFLISIPDPFSAALIAAIEAAQAALKDLMQTTSLHCLFVFPTLTEISSNYISAAHGELITTDDVPNRFMQTVISSIQDEKDPFRPQYEADVYVAGLIVFIGAKSYTDLINWLANLKKLFAGDQTAPQLLPPENFTVKNLKAELISSTKTTVGVLVSWDFIPKVKYFGDTKIAAEGITIIRDDDPGNKEDITTTTPLSAKYDGITSFYIDSDIQPNHTYTYKLIITDANNQTLAEGITSITIPEPTKWKFHSDAGIPPNWYALPGLIYLFPKIATILVNINQTLEDVKKALTEDLLAQYKEYINALATDIKTTLERAKKIQEEISEFLKALAVPANIFLGAYPFAASGGTVGLMEEIVKAFATPETSPPFFEETTIAAGLVLVTGAKTPSGAQKLISSFQNLLTVSPMTTATWDAAVETVKRAAAEAKTEYNITRKLLEE